MKLLRLFTALTFAAGLCCLSACDTTDKNSADSDEPTIPDPAGTVTTNLPYDQSSGVQLLIDKDGYEGDATIVSNSSQTLQIVRPTTRAQICDAGKTSCLSDVTEPSVPGWGNSVNAQLYHGYIVRVQGVNPESGEKIWVYTRMYISNYCYSNNNITGFQVRYQNDWKRKAVAED